ncbi:sulfatase [Halohasta salina]|uniref:sulfatase n=1 Tax=Halohasta salina TaxID=2961621 RepID=UPI0020A4316D|nr:sulfatase [Halohasta salina]
MTSPAGRKNVVFLVLDSLRTDRVSTYNDRVDFTDHIDNLAASSIVFEEAVTQAPWTLPSHASMFTGQYPWDHGITQARSYATGDEETFIGHLREAGYTTGAITPNVWITPHKGMTTDFDEVENFLGGADTSLTRHVSKLSTKLYDSLGTLPKRILGRQLDRAFRLFGVDDSCKSEETVAAVEDYLGDREPDEDFFLYVNLMEPHEPYHPPQRYVDEHGVTDESAIPHRQKDMFTKDDIDYDQLRRMYDASVDYTDDLVGRITEALAANDLDDDTVVVLLSDHGQALGEDGVFGHQFTVADPVIETVLLVDHPDLDARREDRPFELRRLYDLIPYYAGLRSTRPDVFGETICGGYEFPENFTGYIPSDQWDEYYRRARYVRREGTTVVKSTAEDESSRYRARDATGESVSVPEDLRQEVDAIGAADTGDDDGPAGDVDAEIEDRLEALGYR